MEYKREILPNGLKLVTITGLSTKAVTIEAFIKAGFRFEPSDIPGLSHFTEHLVFSGTKSFPTYRDEAEAVERYGGWHMAYTWIEEQKHFVHIPRDHFKEGVTVLLESLFAPLIKKSEVEKEKGVVKEEILKNKSDPSMAIWNYVWFPLFFQGTALARPYYGSTEAIEKISKTDVEAFIADSFLPQNTVLFVAGDIQVGYVKKRVETQVAKLLQSKSFRQSNLPQPLQPSRKKRVIVYDDTSYYKTSVMVGVETVPITSDERHAMQIIREMLGGYFGTHLVRKLRDEGGLIYTWETFHDTISDTGYLVFHASTGHENVYKVVKLILEEFERLSSGSFTEEEVKIAKGHLIGSMIANIEKGQDYIEWYGMQELLNPEGVLSVDEQIDIYRNINEREIKKVASKYLANKNILVGVLGRASEQRLLKLLETK